MGYIVCHHSSMLSNLSNLASNRYESWRYGQDMLLCQAGRPVTKECYGECIGSVAPSSNADYGNE